MMVVGRVGFVVGLAAEARLLKGLGVMVGVGGGTVEGAVKAAEGLVDEGVTGLVSFGLAGGLRPGLPAGAVLVPEAVVEGGESFVCDARLVGWLGGANCGVMAAAGEIVATVGEKKALFELTGAEGVDLESGAVARVAARRGMGFAVLRAVCDPAERDLPAAAMVPLKADGGIDLGGVLGSVARRPGQIAGLIQVGLDAAKARKALVGRVGGLGASFTGVDRGDGLPHRGTRGSQ